MVENSKKEKKKFIGEADISTVLRRYTPATVLALLQEVAEVQDVRIDWNAMVKKTSTGITNPREYQMLWRHLAYRDALLDRMDDTAQPLDDDSDLECELDPVPSVSNEASAEAAAYVKVLMASSASNDPNGSTVEGPLITSIPKGQMVKPHESSYSTAQMQETCISIPVWVQKQSLPSSTSTNAEVLESNSLANPNLSKRRRKAWSNAEDQELIAAVRKCGEGNWATILKGDFKGDRTASQLSQRWSVIRKRQCILNVGNDSQLSDAQLAARRAMSLALDMPMGDKSKASCSSKPGANFTAARNVAGQHAGTGTRAMASQTQSLPDSQRDSISASPFSKAQELKKLPLPNSNLSVNSMSKPVAVAAGSHLAFPSDDTTLRVMQSKNGRSLTNPSKVGIDNSLPSNVHFIRTGLASKPLSSYSTARSNVLQTGGVQQLQGFSRKPPVPVLQSNAASITPGLSASNVKRAISANPVSKIDAKTINGNSREPLENQCKDNQAGVVCKTSIEQKKGDTNSVQDDTVMDLDAPRDASECRVQGGQASVHGHSLKKEVEQKKASSSANEPVAPVPENHFDSESSHLAGGQENVPSVGILDNTASEVPNNASVNDKMPDVKDDVVNMSIDGNDGETQASRQEAESDK